MNRSSILIFSLVCLSSVACGKQFQSATAGSSSATTDTQAGDPAGESPSPSSSPAPAPFPAPVPAPIPNSGPGCGLSQFAFCDTFDQGPAAVRGRAGDLDALRWTVGRLAPSDLSGGGVANPVRAAPIPKCKASAPANSVYPPFDTQICDPDARGNRQLMTAVAIQNYGNNSYMIQQPFDFAGRTGKIAFDVDAAVDGGLGAFISLDITEDPVPSPQFQEFQNFEAGPVPKNGLMLKWFDTCNQPAQQNVRLGSTLVYNNYTMTLIDKPAFNIDINNCPKTKKGFLNHFEVQVSQTRVDVYGTDYSPDGIAMPNPRLIYSANISLPFSRGYVHLVARNHATLKYGFGPVGVFHWDNVGFDGPVIAGHKVFEVPDNTKMTFFQTYGQDVMNLGYILRDGLFGVAAGIYDPVNPISNLPINNVDLTGSTKAQLSLVAFFASFHTATETWGLQFRLNGGAWRTRTLTAREVMILNNLVNPAAVGSAGDILLMIDVPMGDLKNGNNTLDVLPVNAPMDYPPVIANISLVLSP